MTVIDDRDEAGGAGSDEAAALPFDGPAIVKAGALASVPLSDLPALLRTVQRGLGPRIEEYRRTYERVASDDDREVFLVDVDHWEAVGDRLGLGDRETDAVRRTHEAQLKRLGSTTERREEFETSLEIRTAVVVGVDDR